VPPLSLYIHIPWCIKKCPYCDFNSHQIDNATPETAYVDALLLDLALDLQRFAITRSIKSIFIGGGTPSLFSPESIDRLLRGIELQVTLDSDIEITLEANPGTFEAGKFAEFKALGINRLSIGVQSFNDRVLKKLGRVHTAADAVSAAEIAHKSGFDNFNLDLMFGLPDSSFAIDKTDVETAISLRPTHISYYQLTLEANTLFFKFPPLLPDEETIFTSQKQCQLMLEQQGYLQYEVSAFSQSGKQCQHNVNYWQFGDYLGIGAGSHGKISQKLPDKIIRSVKAKNPELYMKNFQTNGRTFLIPNRNIAFEFIMNHLRLKQGFTEETMRITTGLDCSKLEPQLSNCLTQGLLKHQNNRYYCTDHGWNFLDTVLEKFLC
jgi:oxygen-independent coproporphyrinogen-3 oxidase